MPLTIRPRRSADDPRIVEIGNESCGLLPPTTLEHYRWWADPAHSPAGVVQERWVAESDGKIVGTSSLNELHFFERPHTFGCRVTVATEHRRSGVGSALFKGVLASARNHGATRLYCQLREDQPGSIAFAEARGFTATGRAERMSRLPVATANLAGYEGIVERLERDGLVIKTLAEIGMEDEPMLRRIHRMADTSSEDTPGTEEFKGFPFEQWLSWHSAPGQSPDLSWIALDGDEPVGVARLERQGPSSAFNGYTGVTREYRGRGIARALKLKTVEWARAHDIDFIYTENDFTNDRMLSINIPMGYEAIPSQLEYVRDL